MKLNEPKRTHKKGACQLEATIKRKEGTRKDEPSKVKKPPDDVGDDLVLLVERLLVGVVTRSGLTGFRLASSRSPLLFGCRAEAESEVDGRWLQGVVKS
jgi:hypothetical protein